MLGLLSRLASGSVRLLADAFRGPGLRYTSYVVPIDELPLFVIDHLDARPASEFLALISRSAVLSPYVPQAERELSALAAQNPGCAIYAGPR